MSYLLSSVMNNDTLDRISLALLIIGGLNWLLVGLFDTDLVATIFGADTTLSRLVYTLVGLSAAYMLLRTLSRRRD